MTGIDNNKAWKLTLTMMGALGALVLLAMLTIGALTKMGFNSIDKRLDVLYEEVRVTNRYMVVMKQDVTRLDTNQQQRLERERLEYIKQLDQKHGR